MLSIHKQKKEANLAEFFLFILMVVVFCAWLHHKTNGFANTRNNQGCQGSCKQTYWGKVDNYLYDPGDPGSYFYDPDDTFPLIKDD